MKKSLEQLVEAGLIKPFEGSTAQVKARLELAKRDIRVAKATMAHDKDWAFSIRGSPVLEDLYLPNKDSIIRAVKRTL